jgi:hypothetical protein
MSGAGAAWNIEILHQVTLIFTLTTLVVLRASPTTFKNERKVRE